MLALSLLVCSRLMLVLGLLGLDGVGRGPARSRIDQHVQRYGNAMLCWGPEKVNESLGFALQHTKTARHAPRA